MKGHKLYNGNMSLNPSKLPFSSKEEKGHTKIILTLHYSKSRLLHSLEEKMKYQ